MGAYYTLAADIRVEQYSNHPQFTVSDWALQLTCAQAGTGNFAYIPQAGIYASSLTGGWRQFSPGAVFADVNLGVPANIGTWYYVQLSLDVGTATFHSIIEDAATGIVLLNRFDTVAGLTLSNTQYNSIAFLGGAASTSDTVWDALTVDNVNISASTPEPSTLLLLGSGLSPLASRVR